jgi:HAE1 family hydrophobic/amphiphilic exporter-1
MKWLPAFAVRRPVTVAMSLLALMVLGAIAQRSIPLQLLPSGFTPPFMWVQVPVLPGAPADHEQAITEPVEAALATLPGLKRLRSFTRSDSVGMAVELQADADLDVIYNGLRDRLERVLPTLPEGANFAFIWRHDPNSQPVYILGVTYPDDLEDPYHVIEERIARPLQRLPGVSNVEVGGVRRLDLRIEVDEARARSHGVDPAALVAQLRRDNFTMSAGALEEAGRRSLVRSVARFERVDDVRRMPVAPGVVLGDVAAVGLGTDPGPVIHRIDGREAASVIVFKEASANTVAISRALTAATDALIADDPNLAGFTARAFFDRGEHIRTSLAQLRNAALQGGVIAVAVLFAFLKSAGLTLLVALAIPLCLLVTVIVLYFQGESLNVLSMMGLMLSVGLVVDNAIVVVENTDRHRALGLGPARAAIVGAREVALAITLATLTTMVVFLPMALLNESPMLSFIMGQIGFPVCYALIASLGVALVYIPAGSQRLLRGEPPKEGRIIGAVRRVYLRLLATALQHRFAAGMVVLALVTSVAYPMEHVKRVDRIEAHVGEVTIHVTGPANGSVEELDKTLRDLETRVLDRKDDLDVASVVTREGWSAERGRVMLYFKEPDQRTLERAEVMKRVKALLPERPGYDARIGWGGSGGTNREQALTMMITGPDTEIATQHAEQLAERVRRLPGVASATIEDAREGNELRYRVDRESTERAGLSPLVVGGSIDYTLRGRPVGWFHGAAREIEIRVELKAEDKEDVQQLGELAVRPFAGQALRGAAGGGGAPPPMAPGDAGDGVPLSLLARAERSPGYGRIVRQDRRTIVKVDVLGDEEALFDQLRDVMKGVDLPDGYSVDFGSRFRERQENEAGGLFALQLAIALVFFLMGVLFESFLLPFSILICIPLAFAGALWFLWLTNTPLDVMAIVGFIVLVGVVVNNGIVLIDQVQQRRREGLTRTEAILEAGAHRMRPILMTALTTIAGLLPMALGSAALLGIEYHPLARVVIGGLISGTFLTLLAVPLFFSLLDDLRRLPTRARLLWRRRTPAQAS